MLPTPFRVLLFLLVFVILQPGCKDLSDLDEITFRKDDPEWAVPIFSSTLSVSDLVGEISDSTSVIIDSTGQLHLIYSGSLLRKGAKEVFPPYPAGLPIEVTDTNTVIDLPFKDLIITDMLIEGDTLFMLFRSMLEENIDVTATIPNLSYQGIPVTRSTTIVHDPNRTQPFNQAIIRVPIKDYRMQMDNNAYTFIYDARKQDGTRIKLDRVLVVYDRLDFKYFEAYFSKSSYDIARDTIDIDIYDRILPGKLFFEAPKVVIRVSNQFGFPVKTLIDVFRLKGKDGTFLDLESPFVTNGFEVGYPGLNEVGESVVTEFVFDTSNSNIREIFNSQPVALDYKFSALANEDEDPNRIGFLHSDGEFLVNVNVDLPVHGRASDFSASSDFDIALGDLDGVEKISFKWISQNRMPVELATQVYFIDGQGDVVDSLFEGTKLIIEAAPVDENDQVIQTVENIRIVEVSDNRLDNLKRATKARLDMRISTYQDNLRSVRIKDGQEITVKLGTIFQTN